LAVVSSTPTESRAEAAPSSPAANQALRSLNWSLPRPNRDQRRRIEHSVADESIPVLPNRGWRKAPAPQQRAQRSTPPLQRRSEARRAPLWRRCEPQERTGPVSQRCNGCSSSCAVAPTLSASAADSSDLLLPSVSTAAVWEREKREACAGREWPRRSLVTRAHRIHGNELGLHNASLGWFPVSKLSSTSGPDKEHDREQSLVFPPLSSLNLLPHQQKSLNEGIINTLRACLGISGMNGNEGHWSGGISTISQNFPKSPSILFYPLESFISQTSP
jgi:hypothetical protein